MKKIVLFAAALAALFVSASCQRDELFDPTSGDGPVTLTLELPGVPATKAVSDGALADIVYYEIWDDTFENRLYEASEDVDTKTKTAVLELDLVKNQTYNFIFWAQNKTQKDVAYSWTDLKNVNVTYGVGNEDARDAFYAVLPDVEIKGAYTNTVTLRRPFAQLNFGSDRLASTIGAFDVESSEITVKGGLATSFNTIDAVGEGDAGSVTFRATGMASPAGAKTAATKNLLDVDGKDYYYVAMNYLVMQDKTSTADIEASFTTSQGTVTHEVSSVPFYLNYRTNIVGNLFTNSAKLLIRIDENFHGDNEPILIWDGDIEEPVQNNGVYEITSAAELAWVAQQSTTETDRGVLNNFNGKTVKLMNDIDLSNQPWHPIGHVGYQFYGTFDGNGHSIRNLYVNKAENAGLFGATGSKAVIRNLIVENAEIVGNTKAAVVVGYHGGGTVSGVTVRNSTVTVTADDASGEWDNGNHAGAVVGLAETGGATSVTDCIVDGVCVKAYRDVAAVVGTAGNKTTLTGNTVRNSQIVQDLTVDYKNGPKTIGYVVGRLGNDQAESDGLPYAGNTVDLETVLILGNVVDADTGAVVEGLTYHAATNTYYASDADALRTLAAYQNGEIELSPSIVTKAGISFNISLASDIDLENQEWTPIGRTADIPFIGTFDGKGHTISNLKITSDASYVGFFGYTSGGTIKNVNFHNAAVSGKSYVAVVVGYAFTTPTSYINVSGTVKIDATGQDVGVITGYIYGNVTDITVDVTSSSYVKASSYVGGVVGYSGEGNTFTRVRSNIDVIGQYYMVGGISGFAQYGNLFIDCSCSGKVSLMSGQTDSPNRWLRVGGVAGSWMDNEGQVTLENCEYTGILYSRKEDGTEAASFDYFGLVGRGYNNAGAGTLVINGMTITGGIGMYDGRNDYVAVFNAAGLAEVNGMMAEKTLGKYTVVELFNDIDFTGYTWTPVDSHADTKFYLKEINGNGHTISNLTINGQAMFTRFAGVDDVTVKDIAFDNAVVTSTKLNTSILTVQSYQNVLLDNVDVRNSSISGAYKVAPLIATVYNENTETTVTATLKGCDVTDCTVESKSYDFCTAGMVAYVRASDNDKILFEDCTVTNVRLIAPEDSYKTHAAVYTTGSEGLFNEAEGVTVSDVTFEAL